MIECKECVEYAHSILARGEITVEEVSKIALDRHILKGCDDLSSSGFVVKDSNVIVLKETTPEFRDGFICAMRCVHDMGKGDHTIVSLLSVVDSVLKLHATESFFPVDHD